MFTTGRLPAATELARPGSGSNQSMPFWSRMPVPGTTMREPKSETAVLVSETMLRWRSTAQMWVVQSLPSVGSRRRPRATAIVPRPRPPTAASCAHASGSLASLRGPAARRPAATSCACSLEASPRQGTRTASGSARWRSRSRNA